MSPECPHRLSDKLLKSSCDALQRSVARWRILRFPLSESTLNFRILSLPLKRLSGEVIHVVVSTEAHYRDPIF
ncbi:hypothetical protein EDP2_3842 [Enterobacter cloacae S611]|uniref:Uncharacterized protein n=1 Tax=Enterobacter cloacae S611 TaxID=1399146 RepID=A0ABP2ZUJ2_ENTCL|nr:hypothetical protein EDP2_3842 [Enterobacter cloacae S611]